MLPGLRWFCSCRGFRRVERRVTYIEPHLIGGLLQRIGKAIGGIGKLKKLGAKRQEMVTAKNKAVLPRPLANGVKELWACGINIHVASQIPIYLHL